ncbi:MAG: twin-arginine translocase TatA/TatE family subunit [Bacteriovoracia bacterium]
MFGISGEHLLVLLVILLIFGPKRLPDLGHSIGRTMKNFKDAMSGDQNPITSASSAQIERKNEASAPAPVKETQAEKV